MFLHTFFVLSLSNSLPLLELIAFMWTKRLVLRQRPLLQRYKMCYYEDFRVYLHISINFYLKVFHIKYSYHDINSICFLSFMFYKFAINIYECISFLFFIYNRFILIYGDGDILNKQKTRFTFDCCCFFSNFLIQNG